MATKVTKCKGESSASDLTRIRDNQRRARQRHREYIDSLERKVKQYESEGVQATVEIQAAARGVAKENDRLREENAQLHTENAQLQNLLATRDGEPVASRGQDGVDMDIDPHADASEALLGLAQSQRKARKPLSGSIRGQCPPPTDLITEPRFRPPTAMTENSPPMTVLPPSPESLYRIEDQLQSFPSSQTTSPSSPTSEQRQAQTEPQTNAYSMNIHQNESQLHEQDEHERSSGQLQSQPGKSCSDDTSSCEYAAQIITSMRGDVSADEIKAELGCGKAQDWQKCKVDNAKLFVAMDRYSG